MEEYNMTLNKYLDIAPEVQKALDEGRPVVALESTIISHGMPYPQNVETALNVEKLIRENGAVPATIAVIGGRLKAGLSKKDTEAVITATLASITEALQNDDKVQLVGFGSFEVKKRAARTGLNPRTKETIEIPASAVPTFKAGKALKDAVAK
jgi:nucleoid DNA-binding protein